MDLVREIFIENVTPDGRVQKFRKIAFPLCFQPKIEVNENNETAQNSAITVKYIEYLKVYDEVNGELVFNATLTELVKDKAQEKQYVLQNQPAQESENLPEWNAVTAWVERYGRTTNNDGILDNIELMLKYVIPTDETRYSVFIAKKLDENGNVYPTVL